MEGAENKGTFLCITFIFSVKQNGGWWQKVTCGKIAGYTEGPTEETEFVVALYWVQVQLNYLL